jgi:hypothetical protein
MADAPRSIDVRSRRGVSLAIWLGAIAGGVWGSMRYGPFTFGNVALIGLGIIVGCAVYAIALALSPATPNDATD